jgi:hypothetical protein
MEALYMCANLKENLQKNAYSYNLLKLISQQIVVYFLTCLICITLQSYTFFVDALCPLLV